MKDEHRSPTKHQLDHAIPTVIHHPEEDLNLLARWLHRAMEDRTRFWSLLVGLVVVVIGLTVLASGLSLGRATSDEAWTELELAKTADERVKVAEKYPNTPAERWALLQAANDFYNKGFADLPENREAAAPALTKALDYFERAARESPKDSPQARVAAFGAARTLEARNQLEKAIERYEAVAKTWPGTDEARQAERLAQQLRKPEVVAFYKELYTYKRPEVNLPPMGSATLPLPPGHPPLDGSSSVPPPLLAAPGGSSTAPSVDLPANVFAPESSPPKEKAEGQEPGGAPKP